MGFPRRRALSPGYQKHLRALVKQTPAPSPLPQEGRIDSPEAGKGCRVPKVGLRTKGSSGKDQARASVRRGKGSGEVF